MPDITPDELPALAAIRELFDEQAATIARLEAGNRATTKSLDSCTAAHRELFAKVNGNVITNTPPSDTDLRWIVQRWINAGVTLERIRAIADPLAATEQAVKAAPPTADPWDELRTIASTDPLFEGGVFTRSTDQPNRLDVKLPYDAIRDERATFTVMRSAVGWTTHIASPGGVGDGAGQRSHLDIAGVRTALAAAIMDRLPVMRVKAGSRTVIATPTGRVVIEVDQ